MMRAAALAVTFLLLAGCAAEPPASAPPEEDAAPAAVVTTALASCANRFNLCVEPSVSASPDGATIVVANGLGTSLAVSSDAGATWTEVADPPLPAGAPPNLFANDVLVSYALDGTLVYSALLTDYQFVPAGVVFPGVFMLGGIQVATSRDAGATWETNLYLAASGKTTTLGADRQWVAFGPEGEVYLSYLHFPSPALVFGLPTGTPPASELRVARSDDGGASFGSFVPIGPGGAYIGGPVTVDADGTVLLPHFDYNGAGRLAVAASSDRGATWTIETVYEGADAGAWFPALWAGPEGRFAAFLLDSERVVAAAYDATRGAWDPPTEWGSPGELAATGPWVVPAGASQWSVAYFSERADGSSRAGDLVVASGGASGPAARVTVAADVAYTQRGANTDFAHAARLPDGRLVLPFVVADESGTRVDVAVVAPPGS